MLAVFRIPILELTRIALPPKLINRHGSLGTDASNRATGEDDIGGAAQGPEELAD
jgi:hypothetical protein